MSDLRQTEERGVRADDDPIDWYSTSEHVVPASNRRRILASRLMCVHGGPPAPTTRAVSDGYRRVPPLHQVRLPDEHLGKAAVCRLPTRTHQRRPHRTRDEKGHARMTLTAIETHYSGCRFRSRAEARWAVFFDALNLTWEYEPQGFDLPSGCYLPDFKVHLGCSHIWWEVKGGKPTRDEMELAWELHANSGHHVYIAHGAIPRDHRETTRIADCGAARVRWHIATQGDRSLIGFTPEADPLQLGVDHPLLAAAYTAARSARFEYGERG